MTRSSAPPIVDAFDRFPEPSGVVSETLIGGCEAYVLRNESVDVTIIPSRGARIASLLDRSIGKEWMWRATERISLPDCPVGSAFEQSPLVGADECIPTVGACEPGHTPYPDHGDVWARGWSVSIEREPHPSLVTKVSLGCAPLVAKRTATLVGRELRLQYRITNTSGDRVPWLWSWHPLLNLPESGVLRLMGFTKKMRYENGAGVPTSAAWSWPKPFEGADLSRLDLGGSDRSAKLFARKADADAVAILEDSSAGASLKIDLSHPALSALGIWINQGGWNGYRHVALEPTTAPLECPTDASPSPMLEPGGTEEFGITISVD